MTSLRFLGATRQVTGSCYLLQTTDSTLLLECGMFQGDPRTEDLNRRPFPFRPGSIDAVILSHAHLDHSGLLPKLVREGFRGAVYTTPATRDLLDLMLKDAAYLEQRDIDWENKQRRRAGREPAEPLYTVDDVEALLALCETVDFGRPQRISRDVEFRYLDAGHILGAAIVEVRIAERNRTVRLAFSGDLGNEDSYLMSRPATLDAADVLLMESTYGDRDHRPLDETVEEFTQILEDAHQSQGNVLIPSFAVGRAQELLYLLGRLHREGRLPQRAVFLDSPMAISATEIHHRYMDLISAREKDEMRKADAGNLHQWLPLLRLSRTPEESMAINQITGGAVIIAGSGMCTGGRISHHLKHNLWRPEAHVVIVGFQASGTPGRALVDGADKIRLFGNEIAVKAKVHTLGGFSAHAGQRQLTAWLRGFDKVRPRLYLVHGEEEKSRALQAHLADTLGWKAHIPEAGEKISL
jgi:metallo-beta-lactamase family protein